MIIYFLGEKFSKKVDEKWRCLLITLLVYAIDYYNSFQAKRQKFYRNSLKKIHHNHDVSGQCLAVSLSV
jgi:hypothetical protein